VRSNNGRYLRIYIQNWSFLPPSLSVAITHRPIPQPPSIPELSSSFVSVATCRTLPQEHWFYIIGYASSFDMAWSSCIMQIQNISVGCLSLSACAYPFVWFVVLHSHRKVVHTPVIHRLQRLALDVVCHDCHWCVCMQANWYAGSLLYSLVDSCVCVMIWDDMIPQESATQQAWWAVFNDNPIANIMVQMIQ